MNNRLLITCILGIFLLAVGASATQQTVPGVIDLAFHYQERLIYATNGTDLYTMGVLESQEVF